MTTLHVFMYIYDKGRRNAYINLIDNIWYHLTRLVFHLSVAIIMLEIAFMDKINQSINRNLKLHLYVQIEILITYL